MASELVTMGVDRDLALGRVMARAGQAANHVASKHVFAEYRQRKSANTVRRQDADLALFARFLIEAGAIPVPDDLAGLGGDDLQAALDDLAGRLGADLSSTPAAWADVTWGLIETFIKWQLGQGYATGSINVRLSTVKTYARLSMKAGTLSSESYALIRAVGGYRRREARNVDEARAESGLDTRIGHKKATSRVLSMAQVERLKAEHAGDGQGRRDRLLACLLADWGLRCGELAGLRVESFDLGAATLTFYREKVDKWATLELSTTPSTLQAARAYLEGNGAPARGPLLRASTRSGRLIGAGMSKRAITQRVHDLAKRILGIDGLSAHDLRHTAASRYGRDKSTKQLMEIFGWASPAMAVRYQQDAETISV